MELKIAERKTPVKPIHVEGICPKCGLPLGKTNIILATYPPEYEYFCINCNLNITSTKEYPYIDYEAE